MTLETLFSNLKGGVGSGNFGHGGRPGKKGGSISSSGGSSYDPDDQPIMRGSTRARNEPVEEGGKRVSIPRFQVDQEKIEASLRSPKSVKELKNAVKKLKGSGDLREDIGEILKRNKWHYENSYNSVTGGGDNYYRGQFNINVDFADGKTMSTIEGD